MPGFAELIVIAMILGLVGVWIWALADCVLKETGPQRLVWLGVIVIASVAGAGIYLIARRPRRVRPD